MVSRESYVFYKSFFESIDSLPTKEMQADAYKALMEYGFFGREPSSDNIGYTMWLAFRKQMDVNQKRYENSKRGGRPPKNKEKESKQEPEENQNETDLKEVVSSDRETVPYKEIIELYNSICVSLPAVTRVTEGRRKAIRSRYKEYGMDGIRKVFEATEASDFLSGRNGKWSNCGYDWIMKPTNFLKIFEGNYPAEGGGTNAVNAGNSQSPHYDELFADQFI